MGLEPCQQLTQFHTHCLARHYKRLYLKRLKRAMPGMRHLQRPCGFKPAKLARQSSRAEAACTNRSNLTCKQAEATKKSEKKSSLPAWHLQGKGVWSSVLSKGSQARTCCRKMPVRSTRNQHSVCLGVCCRLLLAHV